MSVQEQYVTLICIQRDSLYWTCGVLHNLVCSFRNRKQFWHTFSFMAILCVYLYVFISASLVWTLLYSSCVFFLCTRAPSSRCGYLNRSMKRAESSVLTGSVLDFDTQPQPPSSSSRSLPEARHHLWFISDHGLRNAYRWLLFFCMSCVVFFKQKITEVCP